LQGERREYKHEIDLGLLARSRNRASHGELVKFTACILFILLGITLPVSGSNPADVTTAQQAAQQKAQKNWKQYQKQQKKAQKDAIKAQKKAAKKAQKNRNQQHPTGP